MGTLRVFIGAPRFYSASPSADGASAASASTCSSIWLWLLMSIFQPLRRAARRAFYLKNGFKASGYGFKDGGLFEIMVFGEKLEEPKAYAVLIDRLAFGLTHTNVRPMSEVKSKSRK